MCDWGVRLLAARCAICLLSTSILIASSVAVVGSRPCTNFDSDTPKSVVFLGFIPECHLSHAQSSLNLSRSEARKILEKCDVLAQTAVELAVERINGGPDIPANTTLQVLRLPSDTSVVSYVLPLNIVAVTSETSQSSQLITCRSVRPIS